MTTNSIANYKLKKQEISKWPFIRFTPYVEKLGLMLVRFLNTDFSDLNSTREFINKYGITTIAHLSDIKIYQYYSEKEYNEMIDDVINN